MSQSKLGSVVESTSNVGSGFVISWAVWIWVIPFIWPELYTPVSQGFWIVVIFTVTSFIRSYMWRRFFNNYESVYIKELEADIKQISEDNLNLQKHYYERGDEIRRLRDRLFNTRGSLSDYVS